MISAELSPSTGERGNSLCIMADKVLLIHCPQLIGTARSLDYLGVFPFIKGRGARLGPAYLLFPRRTPPLLDAAGKHTFPITRT
jgi:hypothetical protein